jgi:hypothetical protein
MGKKKIDPSARAQKNTAKLSLLVTIALSGIETWIDFDSLYLCLVLNALALVLNVLAENLDALKCGGWGVFIAPTTKVVVGEGCCRRAHRTVRCASHVTQPLGFDRWSSDKWGHRTVRWCTGQSGAPPDTVRCASHVTQPLGFDRWSSDMWVHWTVRWCTGHVLFTVWCAFWRLL